MYTFRCQLIEFRNGFIMCLTDPPKNETSFWKYCIIICLYIMCILYIWTLSRSKKEQKMYIYNITIYSTVLYYAILYYTIYYNTYIYIKTKC